MKLWILGVCLGIVSARADGLDDLVLKLMRERQIAGLSLAVVENGRIVKTQGYGYADKASKRPVTADTLFQAGSISKPVFATAVLHLVEQGRLSLDADVNTKLIHWKVPENQFTKEKKVTLRGILSHSAGLTVHGVPGFSTNSTVPSVLQILNGSMTGNKPPVYVDYVPGSRMRYSGGGYMVAQQLVVDVTGQSFPQFMAKTVLEPLGMTNSTYAQPLAATLASRAATGYYTNGQPVQGCWYIYPEMATAGLWTTASDLALFEIGIQQAMTGKSKAVISEGMARQMLTRQKDNAGLGVFLQWEEKNLVFTQNGQNEGFYAEMVAFANTGQGVVVMTNANEDSGICKEIIETIGKDHQWW
jgi:CubicO group peptidase (beta-lactamase class C family)